MATKREGEACEVLPLQKKIKRGGGRQSLTHPEGGGAHKVLG